MTVPSARCCLGLTLFYPTARRGRSFYPPARGRRSRLEGFRLLLDGLIDRLEAILDALDGLGGKSGKEPAVGPGLHQPGAAAGRAQGEAALAGHETQHARC